jgi:hypothetical protein
MGIEALGLGSVTDYQNAFFRCLLNRSPLRTGDHEQSTCEEKRNFHIRVWENKKIIRASA